MKLYIIVRDTDRGKTLVRESMGKFVAGFRSRQEAWNVVMQMAMVRNVYSGAYVEEVQVIEDGSHSLQ